MQKLNAFTMKPDLSGFVAKAKKSQIATDHGRRQAQQRDVLSNTFMKVGGIDGDTDSSGSNAKGVDSRKRA